MISNPARPFSFAFYPLMAYEWLHYCVEMMDADDTEGAVVVDGPDAAELPLSASGSDMRDSAEAAVADMAFAAEPPQAASENELPNVAVVEFTGMAMITELQSPVMSLAAIDAANNRWRS